MKLKTKLIILSSIIIVFIIGVALIPNNTSNLRYTSATTVSNKKISWGIKRANNNEQPELGTENEKLIKEYNGLAIGNKEDKYVYLTFDEGYEAGYTSKILDILKENEVEAAFFITGHYLNSQEELVKRMIDEGHVVGNHIPTSLMSFI